MSDLSRIGPYRILGELKRALAKRPEDRYPTAHAMSEDFRRVLAKIFDSAN